MPEPRFTVDICTAVFPPSGAIPTSTAVWNAHISINGSLLHLTRSLCPTYDVGASRSTERAALRALQFSLHFLHEIAKLGFPLGHACAVGGVCSSTRVTPGATFGTSSTVFSNGMSPLSHSIMHVADVRPREARWMVADVRLATPWLVATLQGRIPPPHQQHLEVWNELMRTARCLHNGGALLRFTTAMVPRKRPPPLGPCSLRAVCEACAGLEFAGEVELAMHAKDLHLGRDGALENALLERALCWPDGGLKCPKCERIVQSVDALYQHYEGKHGFDTEQIAVAK